MEAPKKQEPAIYRDIIKSSWHLAWRHKFLLLFGFFAAFTANGEQYDILYRNISSVTRLQDVLPHLDTAAVTDKLGQFWQYLRALLIQGSVLDTTRFDAVLLFLAIIIGPIVVAQIALIAATGRFVSEGKVPTAGESLKSTGRSFVPVLVLNILAKVVVYGLLALVSYPLFQQFLSSGGSKASLDALGVSALIILVPFQVVISFLTKFASAYVVLQRKPLRTAIADAWHLFAKHWLIAVEMSTLLIAINLATSLVVVGTLGLTVGLPPSGPFSTLIFYVVIWLYGALLASFQYAAWTTLFLRLEEHRGVSKLARWADMLYSTLAAKKPAPAK